MAFPRFKTKFNNIKTSHNGHYYDSKLEANYARYLDSLIESGDLITYKSQIVKPLTVNGILVCTYRLDFELYYSDGRIEYVETKGFWTPEARIKVKLFQALYGVTVKIIKSIPL